MIYHTLGEHANHYATDVVVEKLSIQGHTTLKQSFILIYQASEEKRFKYAGYNLTLIIYNNLLKLYWKINDYMVNSDNIN
jgi:hypothetical protein